MNSCVLESGMIDLFSLYSDIEKNERPREEPIQEYSFWCCDAKAQKNIYRVSLPGALSAAGAWLSGLRPSFAGILVGGILSGIGNGLSMYFEWEKPKEHLIEKALTTDLSNLSNRVDLLFKKMEFLMEECFPIDEEAAIQELEEFDELFRGELSQEQVHPWYWNTRNRRNFVRVFVAGAITSVGGLIGGFDPSTRGILLGGVLCGVGDVVSTWLAFEKDYDLEAEEIETQGISRLEQKIERQEQRLIELIEKIQISTQVKFPVFDISLPIQDERGFNRHLCNFTYVSIAGCLAVGGVWISGFSPNVPGIFFGSVLGGVANSVSTCLIWEKANDAQIKKATLEDFPLLAMKVNALSKKILRAMSFVELEFV